MARQSRHVTVFKYSQKHETKIMLDSYNGKLIFMMKYVKHKNLVYVLSVK